MSFDDADGAALWGARAAPPLAGAARDLGRGLPCSAQLPGQHAALCCERAAPTATFHSTKDEGGRGELEAPCSDSCKTREPPTLRSQRDQAARERAGITRELLVAETERQRLEQERLAAERGRRDVIGRGWSARVEVDRHAAQEAGSESDG